MHVIVKEILWFVCAPHRYECKYGSRQQEFPTKEARAMTELTFVQHFRQDTWDPLIYHSVAIANEYELPECFCESDIVIDIGAHIGSFTYAVLQRGAGHVFAVEADSGNYKIAADNLKEFIKQGRVVLTYGAIWRSDSNDDVLYYEGHPNKFNTGGGGVIWGKKGNPVPKISFDDFLMEVTDHGRKNISLLKLDCEGSEWPILLTSEKLNLINEICGEFHEINGEYDSLDLPFSVLGWSEFTVSGLVHFLDARGFQTTFHRHSGYDGRPCRVGAFWSTQIKTKNRERGQSLGQS